jgi:uncharacterized protein (DUF1330 family)
MPAYAVVDVEIFDVGEYLQYQRAIAALLGAAGARYLARGGEFRVFAGDYEPRRIILVEFPSLDAIEDFLESEQFLALEPLRLSCSRARLIGVEGLREHGTTIGGER